MTSELGPIVGVMVYTEPARFDAMRAFYVDTLRLPVRRDKPGFVNFEWDGLRLTVTVHEGVRGANRDPLHLMLNFVVDDLDAAHARLREAGVEFMRDPGPEQFGRVATLRDPDGNLLQLFEFTPAT